MFNKLFFKSTKATNFSTSSLREYLHFGHKIEELHWKGLKDNHPKHLALPVGHIQDSKKLHAKTLQAKEEAEPLGDLFHISAIW